METILKDVRFGLRTLLRNPGFTAVAVLSLALGIGANTAIFSFINTVMLRNLPVRQPERLLLFGKGQARGIWGGTPDSSIELYSWRQFQDFRKTNKVFEDILAIESMSTRAYLTMTGPDASGIPEATEANLVSGNFFQVLGINPEAGRLFDTAVDTGAGAHPLIILNYAYWERRFHRDPAVIGQSVRLGGRSYTITGVAARDFFGTNVENTPDIWIPITMQAQIPGGHPYLTFPLVQPLYLVGRLKDGVTAAQARANVNLILQQLLPGYLPASATARDRESIKRATIELTPADKGMSEVRRRFSLPLKILMGVVGLVLLIACANVANLLVALASKRQREIAIRIAIGAGRARLVRQLLTESILLSSAGGLLGMLIAYVAGRVLVHLISTGPRPLALGFDLDGRVLAFTVAVSLVTGILFGFVPALRSSRVDVNTSLKEGKASMSSPRKVTFGRALVVGQIALSLALLVSAGLLLRTFQNLSSIDAGYGKDKVLLFKLDTASSGYNEDERLLNLYRELSARIARVPGVAANGVSLFAFNEGQWMSSFKAPESNLPENELLTAGNFVSPSYFSALNMEPFMGRGLNDRDIKGAPKVAVVNETFAKSVFHGENVIGRSFQLDVEDGTASIEIVGIVHDAKYNDVREKQAKMAFLPVYQYPKYMRNLAVRVNGGNTASVLANVRQVIASTEPNLPVRWVTTLAEAVNDSLVRERAFAQLAAFFGALALLLSAIGLYGTISFTVARRTNEIGIRMALGANRSGVLGMVLRDAVTLAGIGILIGLPIAVAAGLAMQSMLYGMGKLDPVSLASAVVALGVIAAVAGYLPARRAAAVDPMVALRYE